MSSTVDTTAIMGKMPLGLGPVSTLTLAVIIYVGFKFLSMGKRAKNLPPGPPTLPILGNLHQIPLTGLHAKFLEWGEKYGGVFSLKMGSGTMIVLFDRKAVHDLVDKKGVIYSERPKNHVADIVTHGDSFAFMDNTPRYREQRKIASHNLSPRILDEHASGIQDAEISVLMRDLVRTPDDFYHHVMRTTCSIACCMIWGHRGATFEAFFGHCVYDAMDSDTDICFFWGFSIASLWNLERNPPVDEFAFLKYLPGFMSSWRKRAEKSYTAMHNTWGAARVYCDKRRNRGERRVCIADKLLDDPKQSGAMTATQINHFLGVLVEGGADTTSSSILTMILCLARNPEHQVIAQKELDAVCGTERMPVWADFKDIPYINCIVKEGLRWHPVLPLGVPHRVAKDDWYEGMLIPKDATVVIPAYAIHRSEQHNYADPDESTQKGTLAIQDWPVIMLEAPTLTTEISPPVLSPHIQPNRFKLKHHYAYGAGRRICPGMHLAERTQWRAIAKLLWAFNIEVPIDPATGKKIIPDPEAYKEGIAHGPLPFQVMFKPRSQAHVDIIMKDCEKSLKMLQQWE